MHKGQTEVKESFTEIWIFLAHQKEPTFLEEVKLSGQISGNSLKHEVLVREPVLRRRWVFSRVKPWLSQH